MWLFALVEARAQVVTFDLDSPFTFWGDAEEVNGALEVVDTPNSEGAAWVDIPLQIPDGGGFHARFEIELDPTDLPGGGLAFVLQGERRNVVGGGGWGLGYEGISPSLAVELDIWDSDNYDPTTDHVGIDIDGSIVSLASAPTPFPMDTGDSVFVAVDYLAGELSISVATDESSLEGSVILAEVVGRPEDFWWMGSDLWVGFTASSGPDPTDRNVHDFSFVVDADADGDGLLDFEDLEVTDTGTPPEDTGSTEPETDTEPPDTEPPSEEEDSAAPVEDTGAELPRIFFCGCSSLRGGAIGAWPLLIGLSWVRRRGLP